MSVLVTVGQKCTLAASHAARWCHVEYTPLAVLKLAKTRDRWTDRCQTVTLRFPVYARSGQRKNYPKVSAKQEYRHDGGNDMLAILCSVPVAAYFNSAIAW